MYQCKTKSYLVVYDKSVTWSRNVAVISFIAVGVILMTVLYPINPFEAIVCLIFLIVFAVATVIIVARVRANKPQT